MAPLPSHISRGPRELYFDASGLRGRPDGEIVELLNRLSSTTGGFNEVLSRVSIPCLKQSERAQPAKPRSYAELDTWRKRNPTPGRTYLVDAFDKLYALGVRKIQSLDVEDHEAPSHSDEAIEAALLGRDSVSTGQASRPIVVETWNWLKPDLNIGVIAVAVPTVKKVTLYWSGNQTVLHGWAGEEGIPRLFRASEGNLKRITIIATPGLETRERMDRALGQFEQEVRRRTDQRLNIQVVHQMSGLPPNLASSKAEEGGRPDGDNRAGEVQKQHEWIISMEGFRGEVEKAQRDLLGTAELGSGDRVKVALLDDGVDLTGLEMHGGIVRLSGQSFHDDGGFQLPWYAAAEDHGTVMANMILRLNPWADLHVMRLYRRREGNMSFILADSAAEAIRAAIESRVSIISMSWSIKQELTETLSLVTGPGGDVGVPTRSTSGHIARDQNDPIRMLRQAVYDADRAGILMFCAACDDTDRKPMNSLPYQQAPGRIFRIGAALASGERWDKTEDHQSIDYFLPGVQVADLPRSGAGPESVEFHNGSSISTALAAGLASLIIHCAMLLQKYNQTRPGQKGEEGYRRFARLAEALRERGNMKRAFDSVESTRCKDKKYLPVADVFGVAAEKMRYKDGKYSWEELTSLMEKLCSNVNVATVPDQRGR